jgi:glutamine phosphoribosylpyrophosphate amidotransferase
MCGIAGVRRFGNVAITAEEIIILLCAIEHRGNHATGIAIVNEQGLFVHKAATPAWSYTKSEEFRDFLSEHLTDGTQTVLLHTRFATIGDPLDNNNNHPMFDGATAIVHNGSISNSNWLFDSDKDYKRSCNTDSDIVRAIVAKHGFTEKGCRELNKMSGSAAIACVSTEEPGKLLLARSGNPIVYGFSPDGEKLYWASEAQAITKASKPFKQVRGVWVQDAKSNVALGTMPDNTAWIFGPDQIEMHHKFSVCQFFRPADYSKGRETYHSKMSNWKKNSKKNKARVAVPAGTEYLPELKDAVRACEQCNAMIRNIQGRKWTTIECPACHKPMIK